MNKNDIAQDDRGWTKEKLVDKSFIVIIFAIVFLAAMSFDKDYKSALFNDFSGGLNNFSDPADVKDHQALNLENFLFYGKRLRARQGIDVFNTASLGNYGIDGVYLFRKQEFDELLVAHHGVLWISAEDSNEFVTFLKENIDSVARVRLTQNDSSVTGVPDSTFFTRLGYDDSIRIYLNDSLHYVYQILHDTLLFLYDNVLQVTDSISLFNAPVTIPIDRPTVFDTWLNQVFIAGSKDVITYDGATVDTSTLDTLTFTITDTGRVNDVFKVNTTPTPATAGYEPGDLEGYYVVGYNDEAGGGHALNTPLRIRYNTANQMWLQVDTSFTANTQHIDSADVFRIRPPFTSEYKVFEGIIDLVRDDADTTGDYQIYNIYDHSVFADYESTAFDFGYFYYKNNSGEGEFETWCRFQSMGTGDSNYLYVVCRTSMDSFPIVGDSFEVWRKVSSSQRDAPSLLTHWQDRQWRAGYPDEPNILRWSYSFDPDSFPSGYFTYVVRDDGDKLTALVVLPFQDILLAFKEKHIYALTTMGIDEYDWTIVDLVDGIGTPSWASVVPYGRRVYFYDYTGWYEFDGATPTKISWPIEAIVRDSINKDYAHLIVGWYADQHLWWSYPSGTSTKNNRTIAYNLEDQAWTTVDFAAGACFVGQVETDSNGVLIGDADSGTVYRYGLDYTDGGALSDAEYESPWLDVGGEHYEKDFKDIQFTMERGDSTIVYIDYYQNYIDTVVWTDTVAADTLDHLSFHKRAIQAGDYADFIGQRIKIKIRVVNVDGDFSLPFFRIKWKATGEMRYTDE